MPVCRLNHCSLVSHLLVSGLVIVHSVSFCFGGIAHVFRVLRALEVLLMADFFQFMYKQSDLVLGLLGWECIAVFGDQALLYICYCEVDLLF